MSADRIYSFDVSISSHDLLKLGVVEASWTRVQVAAPNRNLAAEIACQMAARHGMLTGCHDRI